MAIPDYLLRKPTNKSVFGQAKEATKLFSAPLQKMSAPTQAPAQPTAPPVAPVLRQPPTPLPKQVETTPTTGVFSRAKSLSQEIGMQDFSTQIGVTTPTNLPKIAPETTVQKPSLFKPGFGPEDTTIREATPAERPTIEIGAEKDGIKMPIKLDLSKYYTGKEVSQIPGITKPYSADWWKKSLEKIVNVPSEAIGATAKSWVDLTNALLPSPKTVDEVGKVPEVSPAQRGAAMVGAALGTASLIPAWQIFNTALETAKEVPNLSSAAKAISSGFEYLAQGGAKGSGALIDILPLSEKDKEAIRPVSENIGGFITQFLVLHGIRKSAGKIGEMQLPGPKTTLTWGDVKDITLGKNVAPEKMEMFQRLNDEGISFAQELKKGAIERNGPGRSVADYVKEQADMMVSKLRESTGLSIKDVSKEQAGKKKTEEQPPEIVPKLSTTIVENLRGKDTVSKQFISDLTNKGDIKQVERELIRSVLDTMPEGKVKVGEFAKKVYAELLPLTTKSSKITDTGDADYDEYFDGGDTKYETITLPGELRGNVKDYIENIYESPVKTSAGNVHFPGDTENYFGHTRIEDMADDQTRRVIEVQSDLYQKGGIEKEKTAQYKAVADNLTQHEKSLMTVSAQKFDYDTELTKFYDSLPYELFSTEKTRTGLSDRELYDYAKEGFPDRSGQMSKLQQYNDPTAHFRMIREEVKKAAEDGKTKLQFPTGETAMKIEGLGSTENFVSRIGEEVRTVKNDDLKVGLEIMPSGRTDRWIVTDVLGDGKFKAVPKERVGTAFEAGGGGLNSKITDAQGNMRPLSDWQEEFDISGKVDTNNPIYKFYEKEVGKYLKNKYKAELVTDENGVKWWQVDVKPEEASKPVVAFKKDNINKYAFEFTPEEAKAKIEKILNIKDVELYASKRMFPGALGFYKDGWINLLERSGNVSEFAAIHESWHLAKDLILDPMEVRALEDYVIKNYKSQMDIIRKKYKNEGLNSRGIAEEVIGNEWARYNRTGKTLIERLKAIFDRLIQRLTAIFKNRRELLAAFKSLETKKSTLPKTQGERVVPAYMKVDPSKELSLIQEAKMLDDKAKNRFKEYWEKNPTQQMTAENNTEAAFLSVEENSRLQDLYSEISRIENLSRGIRSTADIKEIVQLKRSLRRQGIQFDETASKAELQNLVDTTAEKTDLPKKLSIIQESEVEKKPGVSLEETTPEVDPIKFLDLVQKEGKMYREYKAMGGLNAAISEMERRILAKSQVNKNVVRGIKNSPYFVKEKSIVDNMGDSYLMVKDGKYVIPEKDQVKNYINKGYQQIIAIDSLAQEAGFDNGYDYLDAQLTASQVPQSEETVKLAKENLQKENAEYKKIAEEIKAITDTMSRDRALLILEKGKRLKLLDRRTKVRALRDYFGLSDDDVRKITRKDPRFMDEVEFQDFLQAFERKASELTETRQAKIQLSNMIEQRELKNTENLRKVMELPPIEEMSISQVKQFEDVLKQYEHHDVFLSERLLETVEKTELSGLKTYREVRQHMADALGIPVEKLDALKISWVDKFLYDTALGRKNAYYKFIIDQFNKYDLQATKNVLDRKHEVDRLARLARKSRKRTLGQKLVPTDERAFGYAESTDKEGFARKYNLTKEEIDYANYIIADFARMRDILIQQGVLSKASRYLNEDYVTHVQRPFLEAIKNGEIKQAFREIFAKQVQQEAVFKIIEETGDVLSYEKFFGNALARTGNVNPTQNLAKAYITYLTAFEKKRMLDSTIPEIMAYARILTPEETTARGLIKDTSIESFVKTWLNNKKGRQLNMKFMSQGDKLDTLVRNLGMFITLRDLNFITNPIAGMSSFVGETMGNIATLRSKLLLGKQRGLTKHGRMIAKKYENFVGESPWNSIFRDSTKNIANKAVASAYILFQKFVYNANRDFLLASMTKEEWKKGEISPERLAQLRDKMGRYRVVEGASSIVGSTTAGKAITKYRAWAVPSLMTTIDNFEQIIKQAKQKKFAKEETMELLTVAVSAYAVYLLVSSLMDDEDEGPVSKFMKKAKTESISIISAMDPSFWSSPPRLLQFVNDLAVNAKLLLTLEKYKEKQGYKGLDGLIKTLLPTAISGAIIGEDQPISIKDEKQKEIDFYKKAISSGKMDEASAVKELQKKLDNINKKAVADLKENIGNMTKEQATSQIKSLVQEGALKATDGVKILTKHIEDLNKKKTSQTKESEAVEKAKSKGTLVKSEQDDILDVVFRGAKAVGVDPITAFKAMFTDEKIQLVSNKRVVLERMSLEASQKFKSDLKAKSSKWKLDHTIPLELGGDNGKDNLKIVPTALWRTYTPVENHLRKLVESGSISRSKARELIQDFKDGKTKSSDILSLK